MTVGRLPPLDDGEAHHLQFGRRTHMWRKAGRMILQGADLYDISSMLTRLHGSQEASHAQELSASYAESRFGTLLHIAAAAGRIDVAERLLNSFGANASTLNYNRKDVFDVALDNGKTDMCIWLDSARYSALSTLPNMYARDERELVWAQRRRRKRLKKKLEIARLSINEEAEAHSALDLAFKEEWTHLEGYYLREGLALKTIAAMKEKRSMH